MASTLLIGIGTTGLRILEEAQQYHYDYTKKNKPGSNVEMFFIETDVLKRPRKTEGGETCIDIVQFPLSGMSVDINQMKDNPNLQTDWLPPTKTLLSNDTGAGGMPSYGRLAF